MQIFNSLELQDMANIMNMLDGELMFPALHPFANGDSLEGGQKSEQVKNQLGEGVLYTSSSSSDINGDHRWIIEAAYTNQSSTINLGFMLIEGSEEVIQNGVTLKRGLDYNIDYFTGTIVLLGDAANDPNAKLKVNYDKHELVSFDKKTIFGTRAQLDFGNANSFIGATALILINQLSMKRSKLDMNQLEILYGISMVAMNGKWMV